MSVHKDCGEDIKWVRRDDDPNRFLPPMEYVGEVYVIDPESGSGRMTHGYRIHNCDPDKIIAWQDYQLRLAEAKGEQYTPYDAAREREREQMWELTLAIECSACGMGVDKKCISMARTHANKGEVVELKNPHPVRIQAGIDHEPKD